MMIPQYQYQSCYDGQGWGHASNPTPMANPSSLSNVVSNLVRAQMGSSLPTNTLDEELDKRVAELILQEARKKDTQFKQSGTYSPQPTGNAARTNKRFLSSIIKSTDEHNKAVLRAQAESAAEVKQQIVRQEREERMKRAQEAVAARTGRSKSSWEPQDYSKEAKEHPRRRSRSPDGRSRHRSSRHDKKRERSRDSVIDEDRERRNKRSRRERSTSRHRSATPRDEREDKPERRVRNRESDERKGKDSHRRSRHTSRSHSPKRRDKQDRDEEHRRRRRNSPGRESSSHRRRDSLSPPAKPSRSRLFMDAITGAKADRGGEFPQSASNVQPELRSTNHSSRPSNSPRPPEDNIEPVKSDSDGEVGPQPFELDKTYSSKMDKYFASDYDPRLDVESSLLDSSGLIPPGAFDNWDWMLQIVKARREEKEERRRLEQLHRSGKQEEPSGSSVVSKEAMDLLSMKYVKRGGVREWDEGKKEPT